MEETSLLYRNSERFSKILEKHFKDHNLEGTVIEKHNMIFFSMDYKNSDENNNCFNIKIVGDKLKIETIKYPNEINCLYTGPEILIKLYHAAKEMHLKYIELIDTSVKYIDNNACSYKLYKHYILVYGFSWYSKFGYYSLNHKSELNHNQKIRLNTLSYYTEKYQKICNDLIGFLNLQNIEISYKSTIEEIMKTYDFLLKKTNDCKIVKNFKTFIDILDIQYDNHLILDLNDEIVNKIYKGSKRRYKTLSKNKKYNNKIKSSIKRRKSNKTL